MRFHDWPQRLDAAIESWRARAFEWGTADCCQFVGEAALAITGEDYRSAFPDYEGEFGAQRLLAKHGGMQDLLTHAFGEPKHPAFACRGDVVLCDFGRGPTASICIGAHCVAPSEAGGLAHRSMAHATAAWSI